MRNVFPVVVCLVGAAVDFLMWAKFRRMKLSGELPAARSGLSEEQRRRDLGIVTGVLFGSGCVFVVGAILLLWLGSRN